MTGSATPAGTARLRRGAPAALLLLAGLLLAAGPARAADDLVLTAKGELLDPAAAHAAPPPGHPAIPTGAHPAIPAQAQPAVLPADHPKPLPVPVADMPAPDAAPAEDMAEMASGDGTEPDAAFAEPAEPLPTYTARDLRDPFVLPAALRAPQAAAEDIPPLQRYAISDFRLVAVIRGGRGTYAMVATGDQKGYTVRVGTRIGPDGRVRRITKDAVIVEEVHPDEFGELRKSETVLALRPEEVVP